MHESIFSFYIPATDNSPYRLQSALTEPSQVISLSRLSIALIGHYKNAGQKQPSERGAADDWLSGKAPQVSRGKAVGGGGGPIRKTAEWPMPYSVQYLGHSQSITVRSTMVIIEYYCVHSGSKDNTECDVEYRVCRMQSVVDKCRDGVVM